MELHGTERWSSRYSSYNKYNQKERDSQDSTLRNINQLWLRTAKDVT